jgi:glycogen(starch) synthase
LKIAIFASAFYPSVGGVEELVRQQAHELKRRGHDVIVLTQRWPRDLPSFEEYDGIPIYRLKFRSPARGLKARLNFALTNGRITRRAAAILQANAIDIVHIHCISANAFYALEARGTRPVVVTSHGERTMDAKNVYEHSTFLNGTLRRALDEADFVTACSGNTLEDLEQWWGKPFGARGSVVHSGVRMADFADVTPYSHPKPYLFAIGRMVPQKGFDLLLEAFARANLSGFDLLIAGDGPEKASLEARAQTLKLGSSVRFLGRKDRRAVAELFAGCEFFVLPSRLEPLGIVTLEAMSSRKSVVAARVGGVPEVVIDGQTGLLFPAGDVTALQAALENLADDTQLRRRLGDAGYERARLFDWEPLTAHYEEIYNRIISNESR